MDIKKHLSGFALCVSAYLMAGPYYVDNNTPYTISMGVDFYLGKKKHVTIPPHAKKHRIYTGVGKTDFYDVVKFYDIHVKGKKGIKKAKTIEYQGMTTVVGVLAGTGRETKAATRAHIAIDLAKDGKNIESREISQKYIEGSS